MSWQRHFNAVHAESAATRKYLEHSLPSNSAEQLFDQVLVIKVLIYSRVVVILALASNEHLRIIYMYIYMQYTQYVYMYIEVYCIHVYIMVHLIL